MLTRKTIQTPVVISSLILAGFACGSKSTPMLKPIPQIHETEQSTNTDQSNQKIVFEPNNPGYCGYQFEGENNEKTISTIMSNFAQNWKSVGAYKKSDEPDRYYYDAMRIDLLDGIISELKLHFEIKVSLSGISEHFVKTEESRSINFAEYFISKPTKVGKIDGMRLLVLSTPEDNLKCRAIGFKFEEKDNVDQLFATQIVRTSSFGNAVQTTSLEEFFQDSAVTLKYEIKK